MIARAVRYPFRAAVLLGLMSCGGGDPEAPATPYEGLLRDYAEAIVPAWYRWKEAEWKTHTEVIPGDSTRAQQAVTHYETWRRQASDPKWVRSGRDLLRAAEDGKGPEPTTMERAAIDAMSRMARLHPSAETALLTSIDDSAGVLARFKRKAQPRLDGEPIHAEEIGRRYAATDVPEERRELWRAALSPAADLKPTYSELRDLRNDLARKGGWEDHLHAQLDAYGLTPDEHKRMMTEIELALRPLYQELHTWARYELAERYEQEPPDLLPAHWLPAPLGEDWSGLASVEELDFEPALEEMGARAMVRQAALWYESVGLPPFPQTFWDRSSLYPVTPGSMVGKTQGASTWDINLVGDVRVLMSARPTTSWMHATYREFGFAHAYLARHRARIPAAIRQQPPRAMLGSLALWADLAGTRPSRLAATDLLDAEPDPMLARLSEALTYVIFVQFGAGTAVPFEHAIYHDALPPGQMNGRWWALAARHQGIMPPETRTERWADFLAVEALTDAPGRYTDHVLATVIAFQLHEALCNRLGLDPRTADLSGNKAFGEMFTQVAERARVEDWRKVIEDVTGAPPSVDAMARYFSPLESWLRTRNASRTHTLPPLR